MCESILFQQKGLVAKVWNGNVTWALGCALCLKHCLKEVIDDSSGRLAWCVIGLPLEDSLK